MRYKRTRWMPSIQAMVLAENTPVAHHWQEKIALHGLEHLEYSGIRQSPGGKQSPHDPQLLKGGEEFCGSEALEAAPGDDQGSQ